MPAPKRPLVESLETRLLLASTAVNTFQNALPVPQFGSTGQFLAKGDFNGDGYLDLAVTGGTVTTVSNGQTQTAVFDGGVQIFLNDRTGQFTAAGALQKLPEVPSAIVAADFDGDGQMDVAVAGGMAGGVLNNGTWSIGPNQGGVFVMRGDGRGGLGAPVRYILNSGGTHQLVVGDFNGDGATDIAAAGYRFASINPVTGVGTSESQISVLRNAGAGLFLPADETHIAGTAMLSLAPIAYDTDGRTDLAAGASGLVQFLQSKGDGTFDFPTAWSGGGRVTSADLNRDGLLDLIGTFGSDAVVRYALARSKGGFGDLVTVAGSGGGHSGLALGDFNGDGRIDFLNDVSPQATRGLFLQQADGAFRETPSYGIPQPVLTGDFNNDGRDDAVSFAGINLALPPAVFTTPRRTLVIDGTRRADTVSVTVSGSRILITLNGETVSARLSRVRRIQITTGLGADTVTIDPSVFSPALISAGGESDTVTGGSGNDTIQGDNGSDVLSGGAGVDLIQGGKGLDTLDGGGGQDAVYGGRDTDTFAAGDSLSELLDRTADEPIV